MDLSINPVVQNLQQPTPCQSSSLESEYASRTGGPPFGDNWLHSDGFNVLDGNNVPVWNLDLADEYVSTLMYEDIQSAPNLPPVAPSDVVIPEPNGPAVTAGLFSVAVGSGPGGEQATIADQYTDLVLGPLSTEHANAPEGPSRQYYPFVEDALRFQADPAVCVPTASASDTNSAGQSVAAAADHIHDFSDPTANGDILVSPVSRIVDVLPAPPSNQETPDPPSQLSLPHHVSRWSRRCSEIRVQLICLANPRVRNVSHIDMEELNDMGLGLARSGWGSRNNQSVLQIDWDEYEMEEYIINLFPPLIDMSYRFGTCRRGGRIVLLPEDCRSSRQLRDYFLSQFRRTAPKIYIIPDTRIQLDPFLRRRSRHFDVRPPDTLNGESDDSMYGEDDCERTIQLSRSNLVSDMLLEFSDPKILKTSVRVRLKDENAEDAGGVFRDVISDFWTRLLDKHFTGYQQVVPVFGLTSDEWSAVGRVLYRGFEQERYIPLRFNTASLVYAVCQPNTASFRPLLLDCFKKFLRPEEENTLRKALNVQEAGNFTTVLEEELIDILTKYEIRSRPTPVNIWDLAVRCSEVALLERPYYPLMKMDLRHMGNFPEFKSASSIEQLYKNARPDRDQITERFIGRTKEPKHETVFSYLKRAVKSFSDEMISRFLRFTTGSDIMNFSRIEVEFVVKEGLERRVVSHTCGPSLHVPSDYNSYEEFVTELETQLMSDYWQMDFV